MKNIKNIFSVLCRSSSVDRNTNLASIIEILEEITISSGLKTENKNLESGNVINLPFELFTLWERSSDLTKELEVKIKVTVVDPQGTEKEKINFLLKFESGKKRMRLIIKVPAFEFFGYGTYFFKVYLEQDGKFIQVQETSLDVKAEIKV
ncbi:MAG: hypothetical protein AAB902_01325 [Patescibacteria group bacterium]